MIQQRGVWFPANSCQIDEWLKQSEDLDVALPFVRDFGLAIDGGANVGLWTSRMADRFALVIAFEPAEDVRACLLKNAGGRPNVSVRREALSDRISEWALAGNVHAHMSRRLVAGTGTRSIRLDDLRLRPGFVKLDVEGMETCALMGMEATLKECRPVVMIEDKGHWRNYGKTSPCAYLEGLGAKEVARTRIDRVYAWDVDAAG